MGISIGCLIGMIPLLFMTDRKKLYFNDMVLLPLLALILFLRYIEVLRLNFAFSTRYACFSRR